jgi:hypothetical protein
MLKNLVHRHENSRTLMESPDATTSSAAAAVEYAQLGPIAVAQAGPAARRLMSPSGTLSPVAHAAVARITGNPVV